MPSVVLWNIFLAVVISVTYIVSSFAIITLLIHEFIE